MWLRRNDSHGVDFARGFLALIIYFRTVSSCGGSNPSNTNVSRMRSALHNGFSVLSLRMRACISCEISGRPLRDFQRQ